MLDSSPKKILVAVETAACDAALEFAAVEARSRRCGVRLVHVMQPVLQVGHQLLDDAAAKLDRLLVDDDLPVSTQLCQGAVVQALLAESIDACLVVVQHRGMGAEGATPLMSVTKSVAAHAHAPVVAVPSLWVHHPDVAPVLSVGVENATVSSEVVRVALEEAERSGARLRLVHGLGVAPSADPDLGEAEADVEAEYADLVGRRPGVLTEVMVAEERPVQLLLEEADVATMLVVGRHHPRLPGSSHLGSVARTVLRWSPVPVMVVDPVLPDGPPDGPVAASTGLSLAQL